MKKESRTSVQLSSSEQREANAAFPGAEQAPAPLHGVFVLRPWSVWVCFQHEERWIRISARLTPFPLPARPEGVGKELHK